jgi:AraC family transcriptional regulator
MLTPTMVMDRFPDFNQPGFDIERYNQRFHNSNVIIRASAKSVSYPSHWGPLSVKCVLRGEENYETSNGKYTVDEDHFLIFNNGKTYSSWIDFPAEVNSLTLNIAPAFEQKALRSIHRSAAQQLDDPFDNSEVDFRFTERIYHHGHLVTRAIRQINDDESFYALMEDLLALQTCTNQEIQKIDKVKTSTRKEIYERLLRARDYMYSCYRNNISLDDIAEVACMNTFYLIRQFRKAFGVTPHQFLTRRRMEVANRLIRRTDLPVSVVCSDVGFNDVSSFGKLFRKHYGVSVSALRMYVKS